MRFITKRVVCFQLKLDAFCNIWTLDDEQIVSFVTFGGIIVNMDYIEEIGKTLFKLLFSYKGRVESFDLLVISCLFFRDLGICWGNGRASTVCCRLRFTHLVRTSVFGITIWFYTASC